MRTGADDDIHLEVSLSISALVLMVEALDSHEYWQLGACLPRNNGLVFIPGDALGDDRYWLGVEPTDEQATAIDLVLECRSLTERLSDLA